MASANTVNDMVWSVSRKYRISITPARMVTTCIFPFPVGSCDTTGVLFPVDLPVVAGLDSDGENDTSTLTTLGIPIYVSPSIPVNI